MLWRPPAQLVKVVHAFDPDTILIWFNLRRLERLNGMSSHTSDLAATRNLLLVRLLYSFITSE